MIYGGTDTSKYRVSGKSQYKRETDELTSDFWTILRNNFIFYLVFRFYRRLLQYV